MTEKTPDDDNALLYFARLLGHLRITALVIQSCGLIIK
jgi:hypothetical protein